MATNMTFVKCIVAAAMAGGMAVAQAQYSGPTTATATPTVQSILDKPVDDQWVTLQGNLLRKDGKERYVFSDGSAEIIVEIDDDDFPKQTVNETTRVELYGKVDTGFTRPPEVEVERVKVLN